MNRPRAIALSTIAALMICMVCGQAAANPWIFLVQPAPWSKAPPPYDRWQPLQQFETRNECIDARMSLHYEYWSSDQDLSHRALDGVCRDQETGRIATDYDLSGDEGFGTTSAAGYNCFAPDEGAASTNRNGHYNWANQRDLAAIKVGLASKLRAFFRCNAKSESALANAFADMSLVVAKYVHNAACFGGDQGAVSTDWSGHHAWAMRRNREGMLQGAQWKMVVAFDCLVRAQQIDYYADISVVLAAAGASR